MEIPKWYVKEYYRTDERWVKERIGLEDWTRDRLNSIADENGYDYYFNFLEYFLRKEWYDLERRCR